MHEASLVLAMCEEIEALARKERAQKVLAIEVSFGEYAGIEEEAFRFAFEAFRQHSPLFKEADLRIEKKQVSFRCPFCGETFTPEGPPLCSRCQIPGLPQTGTELEIKRVELLLEEKEDV